MTTPTLTSAAQTLALPILADSEADSPLSPTQSHRPTEQPWRRRSLLPATSTPETLRPRTTRERWLQQTKRALQEAKRWPRKATELWQKFTPLQRGGIVLLNAVLLTLTVLFLVYNQRIFAWLSPVAKSWRDLTGGWLILWFAIFFVAFPPMIGYSTALTVAGFVYGMQGWFIVSTATVAGSTASFITSRTLLKSFVGKLTEKNQRFAALSLVLQHDGLKLLVMIRLCPLPYSLSNGAISTIPTVTWQSFALATACATPKLLLAVFVGGRLGDLAENGDKMDTKTKVVSYLSICFGVLAGLGTGFWVYSRTKARARELEAEVDDEVEVGGFGGVRPGSGGSGYSDDPALLEEGDEVLDDGGKRRNGGLQRRYSDDPEEGGGDYEGGFLDDEDVLDGDVFEDGDEYNDEGFTNGRRL